MQSRDYNDINLSKVKKNTDAIMIASSSMNSPVKSVADDTGMESPTPIKSSMSYSNVGVEPNSCLSDKNTVPANTDYSANNNNVKNPKERVIDEIKSSLPRITTSQN